MQKIMCIHLPHEYPNNCKTNKTGFVCQFRVWLGILSVCLCQAYILKAIVMKHFTYDSSLYYII